jgi:hypothetical protein
MRDAGSFCYTRNGLDIKPLLSHGGLEHVIVVRFALDRCAARPPTALQECCGWR